MKRQILKHRGITSALVGAVLWGTGLCAVAGAPRTVTGSHSYTASSGNVLHLDFQVVELADGTVIGEAHNSRHDGDSLGYYAHLRIDCMHFLDDHTVILAGVDVLDSDPDFVGNTVGIVVRDNGEGEGAAPDQATGVYYSNDVGFELSCQVGLDLIESGAWDFEADLHSAETGNIQVQP